MNRTKIEWVKNPDDSPGYTWNKVTGCLGPNGTPSKPRRCPYCFAHRLARGRLKKLYLSNIGCSLIDGSPHHIRLYANVLPDGDPNDPFTPRHWPDRAIEPYRRKTPSTIFISSMGELLGDYVPEDWIKSTLDMCAELPQHTFMILTKNPKRALYFVFPDNVWLGVTVTSRSDWFRVGILRYSHAKIKFISFEPLLDDAFARLSPPPSDFSIVDWVIIGAQTQPTVIPKAQWVYRIIDTARQEGIPVFLKNNLHWPGGPIREFPPELTRLRGQVETNSQSSSRILAKSGESSQGYLPGHGSPNDKILSQSQGQHLKPRGSVK